ncbi:hypothetical protein ColTof3_10902 [Colletotrichum tofieldiae]|nr:hypothetical protein ColTof3_10902 [Colletotrichum tofieldiae]
MPPRKSDASRRSDTRPPGHTGPRGQRQQQRRGGHTIGGRKGKGIGLGIGLGDAVQRAFRRRADARVRRGREADVVDAADHDDGVACGLGEEGKPDA